MNSEHTPDNLVISLGTLNHQLLKMQWISFLSGVFHQKEKSEHGAPAEAQSVQKFQRLTLFQLWKHLNNIT